MADMIADADAEDLERWRREGRDDILQRYRDACWVGGSLHLRHHGNATTTAPSWTGGGWFHQDP